MVLLGAPTFTNLAEAKSHKPPYKQLQWVRYSSREPWKWELWLGWALATLKVWSLKAELLCIYWACTPQPPTPKLNALKDNYRISAESGKKRHETTNPMILQWNPIDSGQIHQQGSSQNHFKTHWITNYKALWNHSKSSGEHHETPEALVKPFQSLPFLPTPTITPKRNKTVATTIPIERNKNGLATTIRPPLPPVCWDLHWSSYRVSFNAKWQGFRPIEAAGGRPRVLG